MNTWTCTRQGELYHHGIKGQKWGVRRFQNKDGSLTPAGKKRYDEPNIGRKTSESVTIDGQTFKVYGRNNKQYADKVAKKAKDMGATTSRESKVKEKKRKTYKIPENKSLHRLKLEEKYMKNGMTREEAEQAAAKRIRTEKFVASAAVVTVASAVAYAKYKGYITDKTIDANTDFQRIMRLDKNANMNKDVRQYLAVNKIDKMKYKGVLGLGFYNDKLDNESVFDVTVRNKSALKIASRKRATDTFSKLYKEDGEFRKILEKKIDGISHLGNGKLDKIFDKLRNGETLTDNELKTRGYDAFNILLVGKDDKISTMATKFYDSLKKQGMNAIEDINDQKYSGYGTKLPIITFDGDFEYVKREMEKMEIAKNAVGGYIAMLGPSILKNGAIVVAASSARKVLDKANVDRQILLYKQEHPNTTMSDAEIEAMIKEEL